MVENIQEMYAALEAENINKGARGEKATKIRMFVGEAIKQIKKPKVMMSVMFKIAQDKLGLENKDRSQFTGVIKKMFEVSKDENDTVWIETTKPITQE